MYAMNEKNGYKIIRFDSISSTSDYAKEQRREQRDLVVIAKTQTGGRGTKGRSFSSNVGGLYMTALRFFENYPASRAFALMQHTAVAVCQTLARFGITAKIKWPNDILVDGKKICGILMENTFLGSTLSCSTIGVGLNINNALEDELLDIATTMQTVLGESVDFEKVENCLLAYLFGADLSENYQEYLGFVGEQVTLLIHQEKVQAVLLGVTAQGELIAQTALGKQVFASAEVSLRIAENTDTECK